MWIYNVFVFQSFDDNTKSAIEIPLLYLLEAVSDRNICLKRLVFALNNLFLIIFIFFLAGLQWSLEGMDKQVQDSPFCERDQEKMEAKQDTPLKTTVVVLPFTYGW